MEPLARSNWGDDELGRDNHKRVCAVSEALECAGLKTWLDEQQVGI